MPIYEYRCNGCHHRLEALQAFSDEPLSECPECQGHLQRLISNSSVHFKGGGWYITDYARKGKLDYKTGDSGEAKPEAGEATKAPPSPTDSKDVAAA